MSWLRARLTRREFLETLRRLACLAVASAFSLPVGARFVKEARALGGGQARLARRGDESLPSPDREDAAQAPQARSSSLPLDMAWMPASVQRWAPLIAQVTDRYAVDPNLVAALLLCKSAGNLCAVSSEGALGLMQVKPFNSGGVNLFDPPGNVDVGVAYLAAQHEEFGNWEKAIAAYDEGPGRVSLGTTSARGRSFLRSVVGIWQEARGGPGSTFQAWLSSGGADLAAKAEQLYGDPVLLKAVEYATWPVGQALPVGRRRAGSLGLLRARPGRLSPRRDRDPAHGHCPVVRAWAAPGPRRSAPAGRPDLFYPERVLLRPRGHGHLPSRRAYRGHRPSRQGQGQLVEPGKPDLPRRSGQADPGPQAAGVTPARPPQQVQVCDPPTCLTHFLPLDPRFVV